MKARDEMSREMAKASGNVKKSGGDMVAVGKQITIAFAAASAAATAIGVASIKMAADFDRGMRSVNTMLLLSEQQFREFRTEALATSRAIGTDAVRDTQALYQAISAGIPRENVFTFMEVAGRAAVAGMSDTITTVNGLTTVLNAFKIESAEAGRVADIMFTAVRLGKTTMGELSQSMYIAGPMAAALGLQFQEVLSATASLTKQGVPTAIAMTQIRAAMTGIQKAGPELTKVFQDAGYASASAGLKALGFQGALELVRQSVGDNEDALIQMFGRVEAVGAILGLTGENARVARSDLAEMAKAAGASDAAFKEMEKSTGVLFDKLKNNLNIILIELGSNSLPAMNQNLEIAIKLMNDTAAASARMHDPMAMTAEDWNDASEAAEKNYEIYGKLLPALQEALRGIVRFRIEGGDWAAALDRVNDSFQALRDVIAETERAVQSFDDALRIEMGILSAYTEETGSALEKWAKANQGIIEETRQQLREAEEYNKARVQHLYDQGKVETQANEQAAASVKRLADEYRQAAEAIRGLYLPQLIAMHPAMIAASDAVKMWQTRISDVTLALQANQDQLSAAQATYTGMQENLTSLNKELSTLKERLTELSNPRLTGMGDMEKKIAAVEKHIKRLQYAATTGTPLEDVMKLFPIVGKGMEAYIATLPPAIRDNAKWAQQFIANLRLTKDLKFEEQLRLITEAAGETKKEMDFEDVIKSIAETKLKIDDVTTAVQVQEKAMAAQQAVIKGLEDRQEELNQALRNYQAELSKAQDYQRELNDLLRDAYDWFFKDKDAVEQMGGAAVLIAGDITTAYENILEQVETAVSTATTNIGAVIADTQTKIDALKASLAGIGGKATGGLPDAFGAKGAISAASGSGGGWYVPPFRPPQDVWDKWLEIPTWFVGTMGEGGWKDEIERASDKYRQALVLAANDMEKQHRARLALADEMNRIKAEYNWWAEKLAQERLNAKAPVAQPSSQYLIEMARAQTIEWNQRQLDIARNRYRDWNPNPMPAPPMQGASVVVNVRNEADMNKVLKYIDREVGLTAGPSPV